MIEHSRFEIYPEAKECPEVDFMRSVSSLLNTRIGGQLISGMDFVRNDDVEPGPGWTIIIRTQPATRIVIAEDDAKPPMPAPPESPNKKENEDESQHKQ